jgi:hypothetical protein
MVSLGGGFGLSKPFLSSSRRKKVQRDLESAGLDAFLHLRLSMPRHWGALTPLNPEGSFPKARSNTTPKDGAGTGVGDQSKGQILY